MAIGYLSLLRLLRYPKNEKFVRISLFQYKFVVVYLHKICKKGISISKFVYKSVIVCFQNNFLLQVLNFLKIFLLNLKFWVNVILKRNLIKYKVKLFKNRNNQDEVNIKLAKFWKKIQFCNKHFMESLLFRSDFNWVLAYLLYKWAKTDKQNNYG